jgi:hypothetical protein
MAIEYKKTTAAFHEVIGAEEAEGLLGWLQQRPGAKVNLGECTHLHPAVLQVLMAGAVAVSVWPKDPQLTPWLIGVLKTKEKE